MTAKGEVVPVLIASAPSGRGASHLHLFKNTPAGGIRAQNPRCRLNCLSSSPLACLKFGVEDAQPMRQVFLVDNAVEILEEERQSLTFIQSCLSRETAELTVAVLGHGDGKSAGQAKAFWHLVSSNRGLGLQRPNPH